MIMNVGGKRIVIVFAVATGSLTHFLCLQTAAGFEVCYLSIAAMTTMAKEGSLLARFWFTEYSIAKPKILVCPA